MSELAFNVNGDSFEFPPEVTDLRTRRMKVRGAPELVYGRDGRPVTVPVNATIDDLREAVGGVAGKYRLDPLNADGKLVEGVPAAYVQIVPVQPEPISAPLGTHTTGSNDSDSIVREALRTNAELARTVVATFPSMMESAARLIDAADGAGIPRRKPRHLELDEDDDQEEEQDDDVPPAAPSGGFDINALVAQVVPVVVMSIMNGKFDLSKLGELLDWRKAAASGAKKSAAQSAPRTQSATVPHARANESTARPMPPVSAPNPQPAATDESDAPLAPLDPAAMAHFLAIQCALTADEAAMAREVAKTLSPRELRAWLAELGPLSVPDAAAVIRRHVGGARAKTAESEVVS